MANDSIVTRTLRSILSDPSVPKLFLRAEFGLWDSQTRIDLLLLREFVKICGSDRNSTHVRAVCLTLPLATHVVGTRCAANRRPWMLQVIEAASRFGLLAALDDRFLTDVDRLQPGLVGACFTVPDGGADGERLRFFCGSDRIGGDSSFFIDGVRSDQAAVDALNSRIITEQIRLSLFDLRAPDHMWPLGPGATLDSAFLWSSALHTASHSILKRLGRARANSVFASERAAILNSATSFQQTKNWLEIKSDLRPEVYLHLSPPLSAAMLKTRADSQPTEEHLRRRPRIVPKTNVSLPRIDDRLLRPCYLCEPIDVARRVFPFDSLAHVLLQCPSFQILRSQLRARIGQLIAQIAASGIVRDPDGSAALPPDVDIDVAFLCLIRGATTYHPPLLQPVPVAPDAVAAAQRGAPVFVHDNLNTGRATFWVQAVFATARRHFSGYHRGDSVAGVRVVSDQEKANVRLCLSLLVELASFSKAIFSHRHRLLLSNDQYTGRLRDPHLAAAVD